MKEQELELSAASNAPLQNFYSGGTPQRPVLKPIPTNPKARYNPVTVDQPTLPRIVPPRSYASVPSNPAIASAQPRVYSNLPQTASSSVSLEEPEWDSAYGCFCYQRLDRPKANQYSVIAPATVIHSPFIRAFCCTRALLPYLLNGIYQLDWQPDKGLVAATTEQELEEICTEAGNNVKDTYLRTRRWKWIYHIAMVIADILIILGIILFLLQVKIGVIPFLIGLVLECVNKCCIERKCRSTCEELGTDLVFQLQSRTQELRDKSITVSAGPYGTYIRFSMPSLRLS